MSPSRRIAFAFGVLFLITFITSIPALLLFQPVLDDPAGYIAGAGSDNRIYFGALLELLLSPIVILPLFLIVAALYPLALALPYEAVVRLPKQNHLQLSNA